MQRRQTPFKQLYATRGILYLRELTEKKKEQVKDQKRTSLVLVKNKFQTPRRNGVLFVHVVITCLSLIYPPVSRPPSPPPQPHTQ